MRILFAGIIARYPFGGVTWCSLMYLLGLRALGHEVFYIEDTGECVYDPVQNTRATDPSYGTSYIHAALAPFGLGDRWSFVNYDGTYHGRSADEVRRYAADADLFINLSGGSWFWRDEYARIPHKVFVDSDPAFTQLAIAKAEPWYVSFFERFDHLFTFGANIGTDTVAGADRRVHVAQDVAADHARRLAHGAAAGRSVHDRHDLADRELHRRRRQQGSGVRQVHRSARRGRRSDSSSRSTARRSCCASTAGTPWTPCASRERRPTTATSSSARRPSSASRNTRMWPHDPAGSAIARSAISPSGRPALVQDTGWTAHLPSGQGCWRFRASTKPSPASIASTPTTPRHAACAIEIAREHFDAARCCRRCSTQRVHEHQAPRTRHCTQHLSTRHQAPGSC